LRIGHGHSVPAVAVVLAAVVLALLVTIVAWAALDDGNQVRRNAVTTARTSQPVQPVQGFADLDLGGSVYRQSGNQP
jgi:hypothetical protein